MFRERFEQFSLRSLNITPNTTPKRTTVRSRSRNVVPDGLADLPQTLRGLRTGRVINRNFRDSIFYEAKTTERIRLSTGGDRQVAGFLDALNRSSAARFTRRNPTAPLNPVPTLVFLTPADTTIGNSTLGDARNKQIGIFQHVACDNPNGTPGVNDVVMGRGISLNPEIFTARGFAPVTLQQGQATFI